MVEPSDAVQVWLWIGTIGMALGALAFLPFAIIDLIAKVGFGCLLLSNRKVLEAARPNMT